MSKITVICNQKEDVGKTLTAVSLGVGLARMILVKVDSRLTALTKVRRDAGGEADAATGDRPLSASPPMPIRAWAGFFIGGITNAVRYSPLKQRFV